MWMFLFTLCGGIALALMDKGDAILFFSSHRTVFGDLFFRVATRFGEAIPFLTAILYLLFIRNAYAVGVPVLALAVTVLSNLTKTFFGVPRPMAFFRDAGIWETIIPVAGVEVHSGATSFPSGHTMAAFALFTFLAFCARSKTWAAHLFFLLALATGLSRIYLVQHFFQDVFAGACIGFALGMMSYFLLKPRTNAVATTWWDGKLLMRPQVTPPGV